MREPSWHENGGHDNEVTAEARADAEREQRRKVLALNKLGLAAQEVRRAFVRDKLLSRLVDCTSRMPICCRTRGVDVFGRRSSCSMRWRRHETYLSCSCR
jgi:hypothetical protein